MEDYLKHLEKSYASYCDYLINKYGVASDDYYSEVSYNRFKEGTIKSLQKKKISRTQEGLYCHHIDENKQILISRQNAIKQFDIPFEFQKKDRLVYCDLIEHGILHVLIAKESVEQGTIGNNDQFVGINGYIDFIRPNIVEWLIERKVPSTQWMINCRNSILLPLKDAEILVCKIDEFLIENYPISQEIIDQSYQKYVEKMYEFKK